MRRVPALLLLLVALVALAGCFERESPVDVTSYLEEFPVAPGATVQVPLFLNSTMAFKQDLGLRVGELPQGWTYRLSADQVSLPGYKGRYVVVDLTAPQDAPEGARDLEVHVGDTRAAVRVNVTQPGGAVQPGEVLEVALVHFDANGTVLGQAPEGFLAPRGLKHARDAPAQPPATRLHLGPGEAPEGATAVPPALAERLLAARHGETLLLPTAAVPDPWRHEGPSDGSRLLVLLKQPAPPEAP